jgi:hypothetical protein
MFETAAQKNFLLQLDGVELDFTTFTVKALLGFHITDVYEDGSQEQVFKFNLTDASIAENSIAIGDTFTYTFGAAVFSFSVQLFTPDLTGWSIMTASFEGRS